MVTINYRDGRPIYEQVKDDLRRLVVTGAMRPGEKLPSVRELAVSLAINPNTSWKARGTSSPSPARAASAPSSPRRATRGARSFSRGWRKRCASFAGSA